MKRIRFTIANLLVVVLFVAVGFAALRESSDLWESGIFTVTLGILLLSILLVVHRSESKRAFWLGFALFGWTYTGLTLLPSIESRLITTKALAYLDSKVPGRSSWYFQDFAVNLERNQIARSNQGIVGIWDATTGKLLGGWNGTTENFVRIGHSLFAFVAALLGGQLSGYLYTKNRQGTLGPLPAPVSTSNDSAA